MLLLAVGNIKNIYGICVFSDGIMFIAGFVRFGKPVQKLKLMDHTHMMTWAWTWTQTA
jgi:hypothetical protein